MRSTILFSIPVAMGLFATAGICGTMTYSSQPAFDAAAGPVTSIFFTAPSGEDPVVPTYSADGVVFQGERASGDGLALVSPSLFYLYDRNGSNADLDAYPNSSSMVITLPANTYAAGFDFFNVITGSSASDLENIIVGGQMYQVTPPVYNGEHNGTDLAFFGIVSTAPIPSITLNANGATTGTDIEEFQFKTESAMAAPEPGFMAVSAALLIGLTGWRLKTQRPSGRSRNAHS